MKRFPVVLALWVAMLAWNDQARAADLLPGAAIGDDTVAIVWVDVTKIDHEQAMATLKTAMGDDVKVMDTPMKQFAMMRQSFLNAGGQGFAIVVRAPETGRMPDPFFLVKAKPDAQLEGLEAYLKLLAGGEPMVKVGKDAIIVADRDRDIPQLGDKGGKNHKLFMKQLSKLTEGKSSPAAVVFKPNKRLRMEMDSERPNAAQMDQFMPGMSQLFFLADHAVKSEMITLTATLGEKPTATLTAVTKDADAAKALVAQHGKAVAGLKQMEAMIQQQGGRIGAEAASFTIMKLLLDQKPKVDGKSVSLSAETKTIQGVGKLAVGIIKMEQERAKRYALQNQMRQLLQGIQAYAADNNGNAPDKLEDIAKYIGGKDALAKLLKHPITGEKVGIQYFKPPTPLSQIERPHITALLFEVRKGKIVEGGVTGYADGHTQGGRNTFNQGAIEDKVNEAPAAVEEGN